MKIKHPFAKPNKDIILSLLLISMVLTISMFIFLTFSSAFFPMNESLSNAYNVLGIISMVTGTIVAVCFVLYFALIKKTKLNSILLIAFTVLIIGYILGSLIFNYLSSNLPTGPDYTAVSNEYSRLLKDNTQQEAKTLLIDWINKQEDVKDARIKDNINGEEDIYFTVKGFGPNSFDQSFPLKGLEDGYLYTDCVTSCPPVGTDNHDVCVSTCNSSLGR